MFGKFFSRLNTVQDFFLAMHPSVGFVLHLFLFFPSLLTSALNM